MAGSGMTFTFTAPLRKIKAAGGVEVQLHSFLTLAQEKGEWPVLDSIKAEKFIELLGDSRHIEWTSAALNYFHLRWKASRNGRIL
jgi:hypothetical protein